MSVPVCQILSLCLISNHIFVTPSQVHWVGSWPQTVCVSRPRRASRVCWSLSCPALLPMSRPCAFTWSCPSVRLCTTPKTTSPSPSRSPWPSSGWTPTPAKCLVWNLISLTLYLCTDISAGFVSRLSLSSTRLSSRQTDQQVKQSRMNWISVRSLCLGSDFCCFVCNNINHSFDTWWWSPGPNLWKSAIAL